MEEIKCGELFRTKKGNIFKLDGYWLFNDKYKEIDIVKHSSNPIDILKIGDFIYTDYGWGWYHHKVDENTIVIDDGDEFIDVKKDEIHRILTQEMLWDNSYELKE